MKLAIGSGIAFRDGAEAGRLKWWRSKGCEGVVFYDALPDFYRTPPERFRDLRKMVEDAGMAVAGFNALRKSLFIPELAEIDDGRLRRCLEVCEVLGAPILDISVNVPIPHGLDPMAMAARPTFRGAHASHEAFVVSAARLKPIAQALARFGAELSIELHDDGLQDTADGCLKLVDLIGEPNVGVNPDVGNWYRVPYQHPDSWRAQVAKLAPKTNYWEVKNYKRILVPADGCAYSWNVDLDEGDIDFRECTTILWRAGFRGWVCGEGGQGDYVRSNLKYIEYMRWILDEWIPGMADS
jgi:sugar phosphate isomerase/epimerase